MKKEEKTQITKAKIFAAAMKEFGTKGYAGGSINNICKTGINKGLIYHNYKDKDALYLECVKKSCEDLLGYILDRKADNGFVEYMRARMHFFKEHEWEAYIFLETRTNPPHQLKEQIEKIYTKFDELNISIFEKELMRHELRSGVLKEDALHYFLEIQKIFHYKFANEWNNKESLTEQLDLHESYIKKIFDFMLYGIAKGGNEA